MAFKFEENKGKGKGKLKEKGVKNSKKKHAELLEPLKTNDRKSRTPEQEADFKKNKRSKNFNSGKLFSILRILFVVDSS